MKKFLKFSLIAFLCFGITTSAFAAVTYDNSAVAFCSNDAAVPPVCTSNTTLTYTIAVASGTNRQLAVDVFIGCNSGETAPTVSSINLDGVAMTQLASNLATARNGYRFVLPAGSQPTVGTDTVTIVLSASLAVGCVGGGSHSDILSSWALSAAGVDQTTPMGTTVTATGSSASAAVSGFTSGANDLGMSGMCGGSNTTTTTETRRVGPSGSEANSCGSISGGTAAGADTSFSWALPSDSWIAIGGAFKASTAVTTVSSAPKFFLGLGQFVLLNGVLNL